MTVTVTGNSETLPVLQQKERTHTQTEESMEGMGPVWGVPWKHWAVSVVGSAGGDELFVAQPAL